MTVSVYTPPPPSSGVVGGYPIPSLADERNTYVTWGWTWGSGVTESDKVVEKITNYYVSDPDIHGDTEGDDLWTYLMMYRRSGNPVYLNRAEQWARYFKEDYRLGVGSSGDNLFFDRDNYSLDHMYGWGLVGWYEHTCSLGSCDTTAVAEAEALAGEVEKLWVQTLGKGSWPAPGYNVAYYGPRMAARHLLLATRVAEVTKKQRWIDMRDKLIELWLNAPAWDAQRGMYFYGDESTDERVGSGAYAAGARIQSTFQLGVLMEALFHAYRTTGNPEIRNRIIAISEFVYQYGMDPYYQYTGSRFGIVDGKIWHDHSASCGTSCTYWEDYSISLVNTLVMGYKFTGEQRFYTRAKHHFNRATKAKYGSTTVRLAADNEVHHFVDTIFDPSHTYFYMNYNKGELQYTYLLFENGGNPSVQ